MSQTLLQTHEFFMQQLLNKANEAHQKGEVPIAAMIVKDAQVLSINHNSCETNQDATNHAEMLCIREVSQKIKSWRLDDCLLYVTAEPCMMCLGAILQSRIKKLIYGCIDTKRPNICTQTKEERDLNLYSDFESLEGKTSFKDSNHKIEVIGGILKDECSQRLKDFFKSKRLKR